MGQKIHYKNKDTNGRALGSILQHKNNNFGVIRQRASVTLGSLGPHSH